MKKQIIFLVILILFGSQFLSAQTKTSNLKPRVVVLTDVSTWETDDQESLVRFLVHADMFEIEGIVWTTGYSHDNISNHPDHYQIIQNVINAYELDLPNLMKRSNQVGHQFDNKPEEIGYWPSAEYVRERTMKGSIHRGMKFIGANNNSDGSDLIISLADEDDDRPIWILAWGGANTLAQAIWKVQQTRTEAELKRFLHKLRVYTITDQDRKYDGSEGFEVSSHQWLRREFSEDLFFIWDECAWKFQNGTGRSNWPSYEKYIQGHGNLGKQYPKYKYGVEGDTPSFLHILSNGLNNPEIPTQAGWGGYSEWGISPDKETYAYTNYSAGNSTCTKYENKFYQATFNNFVARMDWADQGSGNQNPIIVIDGDKGYSILTKTPDAGTQITIDASGTYDPDGDDLTFKWWVMKESGTYIARNYNFIKADSNIATIEIPSDSEGKTFHLICEVTDSGTPNLTSYRRIIFEPKAKTKSRWVGTWATAPYAAGNNTPPSPYLENNTLRQTLRVSIGGDTLRVKFSNRTSSTPVTMKSVNIAVSNDAGTSVIDTATITKLSFNGDESVTMNAYSEVTSDPVAFPLEPGMQLAITIYYGKCRTAADMTFHYGSRTDSYILQGDQSLSADFANSTKVERWYHLSAIDVLAGPKFANVAVIGNSITDGYGLHGGPNNRWTHFFSEKLLNNEATSHVGVLNLGIGATTVTGSGLSRFQQDILSQEGLRWIIVFYGINDLAAGKSANDVISAYKSMIAQAHSQNVRIYGATLTPDKGHSHYTESREVERQKINEWIRTAGNFDNFIDFDKVLRDPSDTTKMLQKYANDWLHPNAEGYKFLGESIDVNLFLGADTTFEQPDMSNIESHYLETECGDVGSNWDLVNDNAASNEAYISVKSGTQSLNSPTLDSESVIEYNFNIDTASTFYVYARLNCPSADDDSFWIKMDDGNYEMYNNLGTSGWQWMQLDSYELAAGEHTLSVTYREDGAKIDKFCISNYFEPPVGMGEEAENLCNPTDINETSSTPDRFGLNQNYPNPFNPETKIQYSIPKTSDVTLKIYDVLGREVDTLVNNVQLAGQYTVIFDGKDLTSGVYFYQIVADDFISTKKLVLMK